MTLPEWDNLQDKIKAQIEETAENAVKTAVSPLLSEAKGYQATIGSLRASLIASDAALSKALQEADDARSWAIAGWCAAGGAVLAGGMGILVALLVP